MAFDKETHRRLKVYVPAEYYALVDEYNCGMGLAALAAKLLADHFTNLELKKELARVNKGQ
ncbi:hypothetical protein [Stutzerimonas stutzeri]|uniref:hypothetical protein n=1 Tax=Stutzerimonas stutzeri TaxID=316 RepID=UPI002446CC83|nr:hypothetical protein [Stutzerimonas stutzeri]MDH1588714.1 hypothetical protein [Stutzerimonas stutzeri]